MAVTLTGQVQAWPADSSRDASHDDWLDDGEGLHTVFARDLPGQLNNLATYCNPWAQYLQSVAVASPNLTITTSTPGEFMIFECPIVVPPGAVSMQWIAGVVNVSGTGTINTCAAYPSIAPYTKAAQTSVFDRTGISQPSSARARLFGGASAPVSHSRVVALSSNGYVLARPLLDITTPIAAPWRYCTTRRSASGSTLLSNLVFTLTCDSPSSLVMGVSDFTVWFLYE